MAGYFCARLREGQLPRTNCIGLLNSVIAVPLSAVELWATARESHTQTGSYLAWSWTTLGGPNTEAQALVMTITRAVAYKDTLGDLASEIRGLITACPGAGVVYYECSFRADQRHNAPCSAQDQAAGERERATAKTAPPRRAVRYHSGIWRKRNSRIRHAVYISPDMLL